MHVEFVLPGPPISNQQSTARGKANLARWRAQVESAARVAWVRPPLASAVRVTLINFHLADKPPVDVDNMSKPVRDAMNGLVYVDDRQVRQAEIVHLRLTTPIVVPGTSRVLVDAVWAGIEFVYVRVAEPLDPYPLPR